MLNEALTLCHDLFGALTFILLAIMFFDCCVKLLFNVTNKTASFSGFLKCIALQCGIIILVVLAYIIDLTLAESADYANMDIGVNFALGTLTCYWLIVYEAMDMLGYLKQLGVPVPDFIGKRLKQFEEIEEEKYEDKHPTS